MIKILIILFLLTACNNEDPYPAKNISEEDVQTQDSEKDDVDEDKNKLTFDTSSSYMNLFQSMGFKETETVGDKLVPLDGELVDLSAYPVEEMTSNPSVGLKIWKDKLLLITTEEEADQSINLVLMEANKAGNIEKTVLAEDVFYLEPFVSYRDDLLYYSYLAKDGKSYIKRINLADKSKDGLKDFDLVLDESQSAKGQMVTYLNFLDDRLVYQVTSYDEEPVNDSPGSENSLVFADDMAEAEKEFDTMHIDSIYKLDEAYLLHERMFDESPTSISLVDEDFEELFSIDDYNLNQIDGLLTFSYKSKDLILIKELGEYLILIDEEGKTSYNLSKNINSQGENVRILGDKLLIFKDDELTILEKNN